MNRQRLNADMGRTAYLEQDLRYGASGEETYCHDMPSLVLCCTSVRLPFQLWRERAELVRAEGTAAVADALLPRWLTPGHSAAHPDDVSWLREQVLGTSPSGYASGCEAMATMDIAEGLADISAPALVVVGAQDPATPVGHAELIVSRVPGARLTVVDPGAHLLNVERPDVVTRLITEHLVSTP
jgi:3-oxoadipate enol-lactonase